MGRVTKSCLESNATLYCGGQNVNRCDVTVMSSGLCKKLEGAVFPFQVESLEDGIDDTVHAGNVDEADHGPGSSSYFHETAFDDIGGAHLLPQVPRQGKERQQFR